MNKWKSWLISLVVMVIVGMSVLLAENAHAVDPEADVLGEWRTLPYEMPINPIHVGLLRPDSSGHVKVLVVAGSENGPASERNVAAILDLTVGTVVVQDISWDLFCSAMSFLPDGRVFITGGTDAYSPSFTGEAYTVIYNPITHAFTEMREMYESRWYPTNTVLSDGRIVTIAGLNKYNQRSRTMEIYNPILGTWTSYPLSFAPPLYPKGHLLSNGKVFYTGPGRPLREFNPVNNTWRSFTQLAVSSRTYGSSVLLPLVPPYTPAESRILIAGGGNTREERRLAEIIRPVDPVSWAPVASMQYERIYQNATLLPTSHVLVTGGTIGRQAEWFNPATNQWTTLATASYFRGYHSVALVLPDATVLTAGSNPVAGQYEHKMEIFSPPYLFTRNSSGAVVPAVQPTINTATPSTIRHNSSFPVYTPDANTIVAAMLMSPGAATHSVDMTQRAIKLPFTLASYYRLNAVAPPNGAVAAEGYYLLFLVNASGVPSVAKWVRLTK